MSQICIARKSEDLHLLADAEKFLNAMRQKPEGSLAEVLGDAPGITVLGGEGDGLRIKTDPVRALDILNAPTDVHIQAGHEPSMTITMTPHDQPIEQLIADLLKTGSGHSGPGARPSRGLKG